MTKHPYRSQFPAVGPRMVEKLELLGIHNEKELRAIGAVGAMKAYMIIHGGWKPGMCSCLTYQFEGILRNIARNKIPDDVKTHLKNETHRLRKEFDS